MAYPGHFTSLFFLLLLLLLPLTSILSDPDDTQCLTHLYQSISNLHPTNSNPCNGSSSSIDGITCNNGRVFRLTFPNLSLSGTLSPFISNCTNLQALDLSSNSLSGPIPSDLQYLSNLVVLNLSANGFSSYIPPELALCAYLNVIDLSDNELTGQIPQQLGLLVRLTVLDLKNNRLSGMIPSALGSRFNVSSYEGGNKGLYGYPLAPMKGGGRGLSVWEIVGIGLGSGFVSLALSFTAVCVWLRVMEKKMDVQDQVKMGNHHMPDY